jgi:Flp pilus assembly protein TadD
LERRPWLRHAIWTQAGVYTLNVESMALNNAGAALLELRRFDEAQTTLERARTLDRFYPIPLFNLAIIAKIHDDEAASDRLLADAAALGFVNSDLDRLHAMVGESYARLATGPGGSSIP